MGLLKRIIKAVVDEEPQKQEPPKPPELSAEEIQTRKDEANARRQIALQTSRRLQEQADIDHQIKMASKELELAKIEDALSDYEPESEDDGDEMLQSIFAPLMQGFTGQPPPQQEQNSAPNEPEWVELPNDDVMKAEFDKLPTPQKAYIKSMSDDEIKRRLISKYPTIPKEKLTEAIAYIRR